MTTIVYLHGFRSSPASEKAQALVRFVDALPQARRPRLHVPELDSGPRDAVDDVARWVAAHCDSPPAFVGSSLGGFYATQL